MARRPNIQIECSGPRKIRLDLGLLRTQLELSDPAKSPVNTLKGADCCTE